jgi:WD40 repeat protein
VIYGHGDIVTCLARSETTIFADCYIASGSADCTIVLWHFSQHLGAIAGEYNSPGEAPTPRVILTGHESTITGLFAVSSFLTY